MGMKIQMSPYRSDADNEVYKEWESRRGAGPGGTDIPWGRGSQRKKAFRDLFGLDNQESPAEKRSRLRKYDSDRKVKEANQEAADFISGIGTGIKDFLTPNDPYAIPSDPGPKRKGTARPTPTVPGDVFASDDRLKGLAEAMTRKEKKVVATDIAKGIEKTQGKVAAKKYEGMFSPETEDTMIDLGLAMMATRRSDFMSAFGEAGQQALSKARKRTVGKAQGALEERKVAATELNSIANADRVLLEDKRFNREGSAVDFRYTDPTTGNYMRANKDGTVEAYKTKGGAPIKGPPSKNPMAELAIKFMKSYNETVFDTGKGTPITLDQAYEQASNLGKKKTSGPIVKKIEQGGDIY